MEERLVDYLGFFLNTPSSKREEFKMNYKNPVRRVEAYFDYYVHNNPLASWTKVAGALHSCGLPEQATVVENTYVKGMHQQISCLTHDYCDAQYHVHVMYLHMYMYTSILV